MGVQQYSRYAIQNYQDITISNMFVLGLTALVVFNLMHQIPSAYLVAHAVCYPNEAMHQSYIPNVYAPVLVLLQYSREGGPAVICGETARSSCSHLKVCGLDNSRNSWWFWMWETWACILPPLNISPVSVTFLEHQTQEPRWLVNDISISNDCCLVYFSPCCSPPYASFSFVLLF